MSDFLCIGAPLIEGGDAVASVAGVGGRHRKTRFGYFGECLRYCWALLLFRLSDNLVFECACRSVRAALGQT